jgi:hypothetical protein
MSFTAKLLAYSAATSIALASSPVLNAANVELEYKDFPITSQVAKDLWGDHLADAQNTNGEPSVAVATVNKNGVVLKLTMLFAENECTSEECPMRVYEDGVKIMDFTTCRNISTHAIAESARAMVSCGEVILLDRKK